MLLFFSRGYADVKFVRKSDAHADVGNVFRYLFSGNGVVQFDSEIFDLSVFGNILYINHGPDSFAVANLLALVEPSVNIRSK